MFHRLIFFEKREPNFYSSVHKIISIIKSQQSPYQQHLILSIFSTMTSESSKQFLNKLETAKQNCGLYFFDYLGKSEQENAFETFDTDVFPWEEKPKLYIDSLSQHSYFFQRPKNRIRKNTSLSLLDDMCVRIEQDFDVKVSGVYCNRQEEPTHNLGWHKDTFGTHVFVLSLGSKRTVEWRENANGEIDSVVQTAGEMYFMPLDRNKTHRHRVCPGQPGDGTAISFTFLVETPKYAKEFKISGMDKFFGYMEDAFFKSLLRF